MTHDTSTKAAIFGIDRLRMGADGYGITTLVGFMGCPLRCAYCLNDRCHESIYQPDGITPRRGIMRLTPEELYERTRIDDLYFQATGGGVCFGGGEPMLHYRFIHEFRQLCNPRWKITLETSLHGVTKQSIKLQVDDVDLWIVDIKDMRPSIYKQYTGQESQVSRNLTLMKQMGLQDKTLVKIPLIPNYNTREDVEDSKRQLDSMGFKHLLPSTYIRRPTQHSTSNPQ